jgi:hypothetical protein
MDAYPEQGVIVALQFRFNGGVVVDILASIEEDPALCVNDCGRERLR